ncbi:MAG TPA: glycosyltransferase family 2 protein [Fimbriimonadaceae bacterium]|nr:glycosyltransferase family 2 protein [Fimbriimonadaceae bacterium]HRJ96681.1 glycosyltransferase family 2 protein [Fimbriimonadaceae bacterium]
MPPRLAVIVPAYDEEARLTPTLERLAEYFGGQSYTWSVTVIDDGSKDSTAEIAARFAESHPGFGLLTYRPNRGKGYAVRKGMLEVPGELILFSDADLAAPIEEVEKLLPAIERGIPIAIGSRPLKESRLEVRQPWFREMMGRAFNKAVQLFAVRGLQDTQCGFKVFRKDVAVDVFSRCKLDRYGFDFESLMIARDLGYEIAEIPIRWRHQEGSKVNLVRDGLRMLRDLVGLRLRGKKRRLAGREDDAD